MAEEAVTPLIHTIDDPSIFPQNYHFIECISCETFVNFGWETLYKKYMSNVIRILDVHTDVCRLFLLRELHLSNNNSIKTLGFLQTRKVIQLPEAMALTNNHLRDMLPDADPIYLDMVGEYFVYNQPGLHELIEKLTTKQKSYPKMREYEEHLKTMKIVRSLTVEFSYADFLRICPDPVNYFKTVKENSIFIHHDESISYLSEKFSLTSMATLRSTLNKHKYNLTDTVEALKNNPNPAYLKMRRKIFDIGQVNYRNTNNIEFLKEIAFIDHKEEIINYIEREKAARKIEFEKAKSMGKLITCECCYNDELLSSEIFPCPAGHYFCSSCIKKGIEVAVGDNKIDLKCFAGCGKEFDVSIIKPIIDDKLYQRIMRLKQAQEIKDASIEGLETCAFCDYSVIVPPDLKIIFCLNPECRKETCRECREESHIPLRCDQVEKAPEIEVRTMIENKMTEVLIRACYYCNRKFVKEDGCNKMTCACGKTMCYICRKPVKPDYEHFYHDTVTKDKCPLYTDQNIVHDKAVETAALLTINLLKEKKPALLERIDIDKLLPKMKKTNNNQATNPSKVNVNQLLATITGENIEDINNLDYLTSLEPLNKKAKR